jgi:hypothetical protein
MLRCSNISCLKESPKSPFGNPRNPNAISRLILSLMLGGRLEVFRELRPDQSIVDC